MLPRQFMSNFVPRNMSGITGMNTFSRYSVLSFLMAFIFIGTGTANAHPTDSLQLQPLMDVLTGDLPLPADRYWAYVLAEYKESQGIPERLEYYRGLSQSGKQAEAVAGVKEMFDLNASYANPDPASVPRVYHYELAWHLSRMYYLQKDYAAAASQLEGLMEFPEFAPADSLMTEWGYLAAFYRYLEFNDKRVNESAPVYPEINRNFGAHLRDSQGWSIDFTGQDSDVALAIRALMNVIRHSEGEVPVTAWEGMGDLLLCLPDQPEAKYMAAFAFEKAALVASDTMIRDQWRDKALFCLESKQEKMKTYNPRRFYNLEKVINEEFDLAAARVAEYQAAETKALDAGSTPEDFLENATLPWTYVNSENIIDFWPEREGYEPQALINAELLNENSAIGADPNADPSNKKLDPKSVKSDVQFNLYALLIFAVLFGAIGTIIFKFRKAARARQGQ